MKFNWNGFNRNAFESTANKFKNGNINENWIGNVRVGNLCFDFTVRSYDNKFLLDYDLYVGGVDTDYGYSNKANNVNYPYDLADGGSLCDEWYNMDYDNFILYAEKVMEEYINNSNNWYGEADLVAKANEELNIW